MENLKNFFITVMLWSLAVTLFWTVTDTHANLMELVHHTTFALVIYIFIKVQNADKWFFDHRERGVQFLIEKNDS